MSISQTHFAMEINRIISALHDLNAEVTLRPDGRCIFVLKDEDERKAPSSRDPQVLNAGQLASRLARDEERVKRPAPNTKTTLEKRVESLLKQGLVERAHQFARSAMLPTTRQRLMKMVDEYVPPEPKPEPTKQSPSDFGKTIKYPPDGYYDGEPCLCTVVFIDPNCPACCAARSDYYSSQGD